MDNSIIAISIHQYAINILWIFKKSCYESFYFNQIEIIKIRILRLILLLKTTRCLLSKDY